MNVILDAGRILGRQVVPPLLRRVGTAFSAFLLAQGVPADLAEQLMLATGVVLGVGFDVVLAIIAKRKR